MNNIVSQIDQKPSPRIMAVGTGGAGGGQLPLPQYFANQKNLRVLK